jgi:DNA repair photolyase
MARRVSNPLNPWAGPHVEYLGPPPEVALEVYEERAKSIVTTNDSPDVPFRFSVNPYRGCQHACAYCYARSGHHYLDWGAGTDFDSKIVVKTNAAELLEHKLRSRSWAGDWIAFSGVTDAYQPLEAGYGLTRACLEVCLRAANPVGIITKGSLVRRDAELLGRLQRAAGAHVYVSIPFADGAQCRAIEPWAPPPSARFETLRVLAGAGVPVGVALAPVLPGLNDSQIPEVLERAAEAGASSAFLILARLTAPVREVFEARLTEALPAKAAKVLAGIDDARAGQAPGQHTHFGARMRGAGPRWAAIEQLFALHCRKYDLMLNREESLDVLRRAPRRPRQADLFGED